MGVRLRKTRGFAIRFFKNKMIKGSKPPNIAVEMIAKDVLYVSFNPAIKLKAGCAGA
jgi:hypothetical protein